VTQSEVNTQKKQETPESPRWNWTTKLIFGFALAAIAFWLLIQFQNFLGPIITSFVLAYLIHPIAQFSQKRLKIPWRLSVTLIFIILVLVVLGLLTWGGLALADQIQNLIRFINNNIDELPALIDEITTRTYQIGPFTFSPSGVVWDQITTEIVGAIQPILGRLGSLVGSFAAGAASTITWIVLILLIAYFLLAESEGISHTILNINIEGYSKDLEYMNDELSRIWNAFMRGEILIVIISLVIYTATLGILNVQFFFGLASIAAIGQLIPYVGAWITWISFGLVALFQNQTPFDLPNGIYMIIVLAVSMVMNNIIDNIVRTKVMANSLRVHPALVLVGALIGVNLLGFIGIVIAAPIMASLSLLLKYVIKKLNDQDPWDDIRKEHKPIKKARWVIFIEKTAKNFWSWVKKVWRKIIKKNVTKDHTSEMSQNYSEGNDHNNLDK
jgi:predicted PurR-regulated permease PerM